MQPGQRIGKYVLGERIAIGGMAEVWAARVEGPQGFVKPLALKFMLESFSGDSELERLFVNEARVAAQLQHANIVSVFDFDKLDPAHGGGLAGRYYIAMERVEGRDLRQIAVAAQRGGSQVPRALALHVADEVLKGLRYVHERRGEGKRPLGLLCAMVRPKSRRDPSAFGRANPKEIRMFKKLAVPFLALAMTAFGACSSDSTPASGTGGTTGTGGTSGTGGTTGTGGTHGTGGTPGTGGTTVDAPADVPAETAPETAMETAPETAPTNFCAAPAYPNGDMLIPNISAANFCAKYQTVCAFGGVDRYTDMEDCTAKYGAATAKPGCRAYHLCNASQSAPNITLHCPHATGTGPCAP